MRAKSIAASRVGGALLAGALVLALAACVESPPMPTPTPTPSGSSAPPVPEIDLGGTAGQNQAYFDLVNQRLIDAGGPTDGRAFIDNLVEAGYSKASMEVTPDRTTVNAAADSIQFSVRINGTCLLGQYGGGTYSSSVGPVLADGRCLIGTTRPIDW